MKDIMGAPNRWEYDTWQYSSWPIPAKIKKNRLEAVDDIDLMMELVKRGYAVHLPLENVDKVK